jgi:uroporphyrinogen decarboxylase
MNSRERFYEVMNFNTSVRTLDWEFGYWYQTVEQWYKEGLIKNYGIKGDWGKADPVAAQGVAWPMLGIPKDYDVEEQLNLDKGFERIDINQDIYPPFESEIIDDLGDEVTITGAFGETMIKKKDNSTIAKIIKGVVSDDKDWEKLKEERLQINYDKRKPDNWDELLKKYKNRDFPLSISGVPIGFFGLLRFLFGEPQIYYIYYDNPKLIHKMNSYFCDLWINLFSEVLSEVDADCAHFWEDMSGKQGSLISKECFKEFMTPYYKRIIGFLKSQGIKYFIVDTDGNPDELIPLFIECGINGLYPFEVQAGADIIKTREKYPEFRILGGLDKRVLAESKERIDEELDNKLPFMLKKGGFIPYMDHIVPPNVPWENFKYYREKMKKYLNK